MLNLKKCREEKGLSQAQLSYRLKLNQGIISQVERGVLKPGKTASRKLSRFFKTEIEELLKEV